MSRDLRSNPAIGYPYYGRTRRRAPLFVRVMNNPEARGFMLVAGLIGLFAAIAIVLAAARDISRLYQQ